MKKIILVLMILPLFTTGQVYYNFPTDSATWSQVRWYYCLSCFPPMLEPVREWVKHYGLVGDTIINGQHYSKLYGINHDQIIPYKDIPVFNIDSKKNQL